ncbi:MAG TPA: hypothetical protein PLK31_22330, partial [Chloroflexota bacterium]|nr:hypothetical protein [Chloroflexota bacterium]
MRPVIFFKIRRLSVLVLARRWQAKKCLEVSLLENYFSLLENFPSSSSSIKKAGTGWGHGRAVANSHTLLPALLTPLARIQNRVTLLAGELDDGDGIPGARFGGADF